MNYSPDTKASKHANGKRDSEAAAGRQRNMKIHRRIERHWLAGRKPAFRQIDGQALKETARPRQTVKRTDRQTGGKIYRQTDR